ncbi:hypothetical protein [Sphingomonas sp.]|uniref:hypothetical protein n=1 Tax=Sphingomonas sp. TaxID=28214 RepID=UPI003B3B5BE8
MKRVVALARSRHGRAKDTEAEPETWSAELARFPEKVRHEAANLAAHSWDVTLVDNRLLISCSWYEPKHIFWHDLEGRKTPLTQEEFDALYPHVERNKWGVPGPSNTITLEPHP